MDVMKILLITLFLFPETVLGGFHHSDLNQTIEEEEGHDVTLQGRLDPPADLSSYTVDVARLGIGSYGDVHSYRRGKDHVDDQMDQYRGRTTLIHGDLIRGTVTLQISSVNQSDSGSYQVYVPDLRAGFITSIIVVPKGQVSRTKTTTRPPATSPEGESETAARVPVIPIVVAVIGIIVLVGIMQKCTRKFRERRNRQAETGNAAELSEDLIHQKPVQDLGGLAADDPGNHEQVV